MVDFKQLQTRAKDLVEKRGGSESLKRDAEELKNIAKGPGKLGDKAKAAVSAIKDPGARGGTATEGTAGTPSAAESATTPERDRAGTKVEGEVRGKHADAGRNAGETGRMGAGQGDVQGGTRRGDGGAV